MIDCRRIGRCNGDSYKKRCCTMAIGVRQGPVLIPLLAFYDLDFFFNYIVWNATLYFNAFIFCKPMNPFKYDVSSRHLVALG